MENLIQTSVILVTYYSDYDKIVATIDSIVRQKNINFELIISEDSADVQYYSKLEKYLQEMGFLSYKFVVNEKNQGTVKNILRALEFASGEYVKTISPGDMFWDENVLHDMYTEASKENAKLIFTDLQCYSDVDGKRVYIDKQFPELIKPYVKWNKNKIAKNIILKGDGICGATIMYDRKLLDEYLGIIGGKVIYCEDFAAQLMILDDERVKYISRIGFLYELGVGVSTAKSRNGQMSPMRKDAVQEGIILQERYPQYAKWIKRMIMRTKLKRTSWVALVIKEFLIVPEYTLHQIVNRTFLKKILRNDQRGCRNED